MALKLGTIRMRARANGGITLIQALINYKIVTGLVRDKQTKQFAVKKPQRFVKTVTVALNGKQIFAANLSIGSSNDPFIAVKVKDGKEGDKVTVRWEDNQGDWDELSSPIGA
jgi:sulfur-oxidizing protein SoxZ